MDSDISHRPCWPIRSERRLAACNPTCQWQQAAPSVGAAFLNDRIFRLLRNGFAHWAFDWDVVGPDSYVVAYDWERDLPTAKLHLEEADAFHIVAFAVIEILNEVFIRPPGRMAPNLRVEPTLH
jgi:hypothetical protein